MFSSVYVGFIYKTIVSVLVPNFLLFLLFHRKIDLARLKQAAWTTVYKGEVFQQKKRRGLR